MKKLTDMTIVRKLSLIIMSSGIASVCLACTGILVYQIHAQRTHMVESVSTYARITAANTTYALSFNDTKDAEEVLQNLFAEPTILYAAVFDKNNEFFASFRKPDLPLDFPRPGYNDIEEEFTSQYLVVYEPVVFHGERIGTICIQSSLEQFQKLIQRNLYVMACVLMVTFLFSFLLARWLQRFISRPVLKLTKLTENIAESRDYKLRATHITGNDEMGRLAQSINGMLDQIQGRDRQLRESEKRFRTLFDQATDSVFLYNTEGDILDVNRQACFSLGYEREELLERNVADIEVGLNTRQLKQQWKLVEPNEPITMEGIHRTNNGETFPVEIRLGRFELADKQLLLALVRNISERRASEEQLRKSEENLRITLNSIGDGVIAGDVNGYVVRMNPVAEKLTGWRLAEAQGRKIEEIFKLVKGDTREPIDSPAAMVVKQQSIITLEKDSLLLSKDGMERVIADSGAPIRDADGEIVGSVLVFRDVTEQQHLEEQLRQSQKMDSIGQLAGGIAHDFNNMLGGIIGASELLSSRVDVEDEKAQRYLKLVIETAERAAELTGKLLAFSRKAKVQSTPFNLHKTIDDTLSILERSIDKRIQICKKLNAASFGIVGDPSLIQNAILNLGVNARDAMPEGGAITLSTDNLHLDESYCKASPFDLTPGMYIEIAVSDTGTGMPSEVMQKIFEPFFTTKEIGKGTGLGLAAVYGAIKDHHGSIKVYSEQGTGTVFHLFLPICEEENKTREYQDVEPQKGQGTILLVDDEHVIRSMASELLEELGYRVITAEEGEQGLATYKEKQDSIDLVVLDMVMPKMNGQDCFTEMKKINPEIKVIMSSGFTRDGSISILHEQGVFGFVKKPYRRAELSKIIADAIKSG